MTGNHPDSGPRVTSYEGLRKLLDHRRVPPKVLSHDEYVALSPSARSGYDDARLRWFGSGFILTTREASALAASARCYLTMKSQYTPGSQRAIVLDGPTNVGKTTTLVHLAQELERAASTRYPDYRRNGQVPTAFIGMTPGATPKGIAIALLNYFAVPYRPRENHHELVTRATAAMNAHETQLLIVDEFQMLGLQGKRGDDAIDTIKAISNDTGVTTVLAGIDLHARLQSRAAAQVMARGEVQHLRPFTYANEEDRRRWASLVTVFEQQMHLTSDDAGVVGLADGLFGVTGGLIGNLRRILSKAMYLLVTTKANVDSPERLTSELLSAALGSSDGVAVAASRRAGERRRGPGVARGSSELRPST